MKCLKCGTNNTYRERSGTKNTSNQHAGSTCTKCKQLFAFEPKMGAVFSDSHFYKILEQATDKHKIKITTQQLYYALARKKHPGKPLTPTSKRVLKALYIAGWLAVIAFLFSHPAEPLFVLAILFGIIGLPLLLKLLSWFLPKEGVMAPFLVNHELDKYIQLWTYAHQKPQSLIIPGEKLAIEASRLKELNQYAVDKILVCERPEMVDFFVANRFHMEQKCLVMTAGGYPFQETDLLFEKLRGLAKLAIFVLHDASLKGVKLPVYLRKQAPWVSKQAQVIDLGLSAEHASKLEDYWHHQTSPAAPDDTDYPEWLQHYKVHLAVIPPLQLLNRVGRMLNMYAQQRDASSSFESSFETDDALAVLAWSNLGGAGDNDGDGDFG